MTWIAEEFCLRFTALDKHFLTADSMELHQALQTVYEFRNSTQAWSMTSKNAENLADIFKELLALQRKVRKWLTCANSQSCIPFKPFIKPLRSVAPFFRDFFQSYSTQKQIIMTNWLQGDIILPTSSLDLWLNHEEVDTQDLRFYQISCDGSHPADFGICIRPSLKGIWLVRDFICQLFFAGQAECRVIQIGEWWECIWTIDRACTNPREICNVNFTPCPTTKLQNIWAWNLSATIKHWKCYPSGIRSWRVDIANSSCIWYIAYLSNMLRLA